MQRPAICLFLALPVICSYAQGADPVKYVVEVDVTDAATGAGVPRTRAMLTTEENEPVYARADREGRVVFRNVDPARYTLRVDSPGFMPFFNSLVVGVSPETANCVVAPATPLAPSRGEDGAMHLTVPAKLTRYAVIEGRVTDPYGLPIPGSMVELSMKPPAGNGEPRTMNSAGADARGEFRISHLEPGKYWVVANKPQGPQLAWDSGYQPTYFGGSITTAAATPIVLAAGQRARADIQIVRQGGVRVSGRILAPGGAAIPVEGFQYTAIALVPKDSALLNPNGPFATGHDHFVFDTVPPGRYRLFAVTRDASSDPFGPKQKAIYGLMREIEVANQDLDGFDLQLLPVGDLAGVATFAQQCDPIPAKVTLRRMLANPVDSWFGEVPLNADGSFTLSGVATGRYAINVSSNRLVTILSATLGARDVLKDGFEAPYAGTDTLRLELGCGNSRRRP